MKNLKVLFLVLLCAPVFASELKIDAKELSFHAKNKEGKISGDVVIQREGLTIYADVAYIKQSKKARYIKLEGKPVKFLQKPVKNTKQKHFTKAIRGEAKIIEYDSKNGVILLLGSVCLDIDGDNLIRGDKIIYNVKNRSYSVLGNKFSQANITINSLS